MSVPYRLAALALAVGFFAPVAADAMDDYARAASSGPTLLAWCDTDRDATTPTACKQGGFDALAAQIEKSFQAAATRAPAQAKPLLKRDQVWFDEVVYNAAETMLQSSAASDREAFVETLRQRVATLEGIAAGFGRTGVAGRWVSAFGSLVVSPLDDASYRIAIDIRSVYGADSEMRRECTATALVRAEPGGWLTGTIQPMEAAPAKASGEAATADARKSPRIKIRRQGETLRVVADEQDVENRELPGCGDTGRITASFFAAGKAEIAGTTGSAADAGFAAATFDCAHPATASDEEICADPDLAENDVRLNRAWKALQPRLDDATRRALLDDQRGYVKAQAWQFPEFLHPAWNKTFYFMHFTSAAREKLNRLQRERIALLEGFDENRSGFAGVWLAHNAILKVEATADGGLTAKGWKWDQGDWKAGCDYEIEGKVVNGMFRSDDKGKNPDTLERDHASLIVNRRDDYFAGQRTQSYNKGDADEPKCRRLLSNSSTARLFPARSSADINDFDSIR